MKFRNNEKDEFIKLVDIYLNNSYVMQMKKYTQHGNISTLDHCIKVAETSFIINRRLRAGVDEKSMVTAAILHDFYLYDWHESSKEHRLHGFRHSKTAAENARKYFKVGNKEYKAILSHMWPLNITKLPTSREAWILCIADKYCALKETLFSRR
jgi:uncharacterized protein